MQPKQTKDYVIGYRRPPVRAQFKPGRSGNPSGRPKQVRNFHDAFVAELSARLFITENGERRAIRKREALIKQIINKAISGDMAALRIILQYFSAELHSEVDLKPNAPHRKINYENLPISVLTEMLQAQIKDDSVTVEAIYERYLKEHRESSLIRNEPLQSEPSSSAKPSP